MCYIVRSSIFRIIPGIDCSGRRKPRRKIFDEGGQQRCKIRKPFEDPQSPRLSKRDFCLPNWINADILLVSSRRSYPNSQKEAINILEMWKWTEVMKLEYKSLIDNFTWKLVPRPYDKNLISIQWVYKVKEEPKTDVSLGTRYKAPIMARGSSQVKGLDYSETFHLW